MGEGQSWIHLLAQGSPRKEDATISLLTMNPLQLHLMLEVRKDSKTSVDWVNGHAKLKTNESFSASEQYLLRVVGQWGGSTTTCG